MFVAPNTCQDMFENYKNHEVPIDFFNVDLEKYPFAKYVAFIDIDLKAGDCVYIPAYFYVQSQFFVLVATSTVAKQISYCCLNF